MRITSFLLVVFIVLGCAPVDEKIVSTSTVLSGSFNTNLGTSGFVTFDAIGGASGDDVINDIALDSEGRLVVVGRTSNGTDNDMFIARFNKLGTLDSSFGTNGVFTHGGAAGGVNGNDEALAVVLDDLNQPMVVGYSSNGTNKDLAIWSLSAAGVLDTGFDTDGVYTQNSIAGGSGDDQGNDIAIDLDGLFVVTGSSQGSGTNALDMFVLKISASGALSTDFDSTDGDGIQTHHGAAGGTGDDEGTALKVMSTGQIVIVGKSTNALGNLDLAIWRFSEAGDLDTSFSADGFVTHASAAGGAGTDAASGLLVSSSGLVTVCGTSNNGANDKMTVWRYSSDGTLDTSFNNQGFVVISQTAGGNANEVAGDILEDSSGNIYCVGSSDNASGNKDMAMWRITSTGVLDTSFNLTGLFSHDSAAGGSGDDSANSAIFDICGKKVFLAGQSQGGNVDTAIWSVQ